VSTFHDCEDLNTDQEIGPLGRYEQPECLKVDGTGQARLARILFWAAIPSVAVSMLPLNRLDGIAIRISDPGSPQLAVEKVVGKTENGAPLGTKAFNAASVSSVQRTISIQRLLRPVEGWGALWLLPLSRFRG
jgi:hypothetical protein